MAGVGDAVVHDSAVAVDVVGHADDRNPPRGLRRHCRLLRTRRERPGGRTAEVMNARRFMSKWRASHLPRPLGVPSRRLPAGYRRV
jgi:hypothetical protein